VGVEELLEEEEEEEEEEESMELERSSIEEKFNCLPDEASSSHAWASSSMLSKHPRFLSMSYILQSFSHF
jgi:hypothetical protein